MSRGRRKGFSSLELTAALSVILVLAFGVSLFGREVRDRARATSCASNLRQLAVAMRVYADDQAGHCPPATVSGLAGLSEYVKNMQVFVCPADRHPWKLPEPAGEAQPSPPASPPGSGPPPLPGVDAPAGRPPEISYFLVPGLMTDDPPQALLMGDTAARHRGRWQAICLDGHVESFEGRRQRPPAHGWE